MGIARNLRRKQIREGKPYLAYLGNLLGDFYEFLSMSPQPSDEEVRSRFIADDAKWRKYCSIHELMNANHLFALNVREAWNRHSTQKLGNS